MQISMNSIQYLISQMQDLGGETATGAGQDMPGGTADSASDLTSATLS